MEATKGSAEMEEKGARLPEGVIDARKWRRWLGMSKLTSVLVKRLGMMRLESGQEPGQEAQEEERQQRSNLGCLCGCGETPTGKGRLFCQGHSILMVELAKRYVRGEVQPDEGQMEYLRESGKLDRAVERVKIEDSSGRRRGSQARYPARPRSI